jgi:wyosine [tRNA(Phe)-imidazoG37] synthetase (radical SAM superfamily)
MPSIDLKDKADKEYERLMFDVKYDKEQFKDPMTLGLLMYRLAQERKQSNELYRELIAKLDGIAALLGKEKPGIAMLSDVDARIVSQIQRLGKADAEEIRGTLSYKGRNAACARLNALFMRGVLRKGRVGKKVVYWVPEGGPTQPPVPASPGGI